MAPGSLAGHSCAPGTGISAGEGPVTVEVRRWGISWPAQYPSAHTCARTETSSVCSREDRALLSPVTTLPSSGRRCCHPWSGRELSSRHQRQLPHRGLTVGPCQQEAQARFLPGRRSAPACPVEFCGFVRQAEVHVTKLASLSWPPALSESPGLVLPQLNFFCSCATLISVKLSVAC